MNDLIIFVKSLLNKKVNQRVCSFSKLKTYGFLNNYNWDDLIDFKLKPPYIPKIDDYNIQIPEFKKAFENQINVKK